MDSSNEFSSVLQHYEERFGRLPDAYHIDYGTHELIGIMKRALQDNRPLKEPDDAERDVVCL